MKSLLKDNPLGMGLLGIAAVLLLVILLLGIFTGGIPVVETDPDAVSQSEDVDVTKISPLEPLSKFAVIKRRPLFNEDRKPVDIEGAAAAADAEANLEDTSELEDNPLEADLTGIIITNEHKIAMLWDRSGKTTVSIPEGGALEGDLSGWSVVKVEARKITLKNRQGKTAELELLMFTQSLGKPPGVGKGKKATTKNASGNKSGSNDKKKSAVADKQDKKPITAADFMRASLEKRKAARAAKQGGKTAGTESGG